MLDPTLQRMPLDRRSHTLRVDRQEGSDRLRGSPGNGDQLAWSPTRLLADAEGSGDRFGYQRRIFKHSEGNEQDVIRTLTSSEINWLHNHLIQSPSIAST